jgi:hypothetical protein
MFSWGVGASALLTSDSWRNLFAQLLLSLAPAPSPIHEK